MLQKLLSAVLALASFVTLDARMASAVTIDASITFDSSTSLYTYNYTLSGVDEGRKVTGITWVIREGGGAPQYLPASWEVPFLWNILPGVGGSVAGGGTFGVWMSGTASNENGGNILLAGDVAEFSLVTGYSPRNGRYFITENENGSEINYNHIMGFILLPDYNGGFVETAWVGQNTRNGNPLPVPLNPSMVLQITALGLLAPLAWRRRRALFVGHR